MNNEESDEEIKNGWRDIYVGDSNYIQGGDTEDIGWLGKLHCWLLMKRDDILDGIPILIVALFMVWLFTAVLFGFLLTHH